jgi:hypothetical protein
MPRIAAPLNITKKPGVGMSYVAIDLEASKKEGKIVYIHVSTTCRRDVDPAKGGNPSLAPLTGYSADEPFFKAKIGKKPLFSYITFLCGANHDKCLSECGRYEWTGTPLKEAPESWDITHAKTIHAERKQQETATPVKVEEKPAKVATAGAAKKVAAKKKKKTKTSPKKVEAKTEKPAKKLKKTFYSVNEGKVITKRVVNMPEGWFATRKEAEATISA